MPFDGFFTWPDDRFEAERSSLCVFARVGFSSRELTDRKAEKVEPHVSFVRVSRVRHSCLLRTQG